jgi:hypothetical protein
MRKNNYRRSLRSQLGSSPLRSLPSSLLSATPTGSETLMSRVGFRLVLPLKEVGADLMSRVGPHLIWIRFEGATTAATVSFESRRVTFPLTLARLLFLSLTKALVTKSSFLAELVLLCFQERLPSLVPVVDLLSSLLEASKTAAH